VALRNKRCGLNERAVLGADHAVNVNEGSLRAIIAAPSNPHCVLSDVLRANIWKSSRRGFVSYAERDVGFEQSSRL